VLQGEPNHAGHGGQCNKRDRTGGPSPCRRILFVVELVVQSLDQAPYPGHWMPD
jgi:hypothetical protein